MFNESQVAFYLPEVFLFDNWKCWTTCTFWYLVYFYKKVNVAETLLLEFVWLWACFCTSVYCREQGAAEALVMQCTGDPIPVCVQQSWGKKNLVCRLSCFSLFKSDRCKWLLVFKVSFKTLKILVSFTYGCHEAPVITLVRIVIIWKKLTVLCFILIFFHHCKSGTKAITSEDLRNMDVSLKVTKDIKLYFILIIFCRWL